MFGMKIESQDMFLVLSTEHESSQLSLAATNHDQPIGLPRSLASVVKHVIEVEFANVIVYTSVLGVDIL